MASSFDIIKVRLDSYEELTAFENKCLSNGEGIQFVTRKPREFPCELSVKRITSVRLLPPDYFEVAERTVSNWIFNVTKL